MISLAEALWAFQGTEAGDLSFQAGDKLEVLDKVKDDWWKGRVAGRDATGLFPSSYVREVQVLKEKPALPNLPPRSGGGGAYGPGGNPMTDVAHGTSVFDAQQHEEGAKKPLLGKNGEKFGKKLGNAAIFGAVSPVFAFACVCVCVWRCVWLTRCVGRDDRWEDREYDFLNGGREVWFSFFVGSVAFFYFLACLLSRRRFNAHADFLIYILPALILWPVWLQILMFAPQSCVPQLIVSRHSPSLACPVPSTVVLWSFPYPTPIQH